MVWAEGRDPTPPRLQPPPSSPPASSVPVPLPPLLRLPLAPPPLRPAPGAEPPSGPPLALGVPRSWPRGRGAGEGIARREGKQSQRDKRQPKPAPAVGSCPGRTHGAGCGHRSSCRQLPWKALVLEGAKERDFAARSFSSPGIFSSLCPLVSPDSAFLSAGGAEVGEGWGRVGFMAAVTPGSGAGITSCHLIWAHDETRAGRVVLSSSCGTQPGSSILWRLLRPHGPARRQRQQVGCCWTRGDAAVPQPHPLHGRKAPDRIC